MSHPAPLAVSVTTFIAADATSLYDLIADITAMPKYSPENVAGEWLDGATHAAVGADPSPSTPSRRDRPRRQPRSRHAHHARSSERDRRGR